MDHDKTTYDVVDVMFEMWIYLRVLRISWQNHVTNEEVLRGIGKQ